MEYIELADDVQKTPCIFGVDYIRENGTAYVSSITCWVLGLEKRIELNSIMHDDFRYGCEDAVRLLMKSEFGGKVEIDAGALW